MSHRRAASRQGRTVVAQPDPDRVKQLILEVVDTQLRLNDPPETRATYERLRRAGHSDADTRRLLALVVSAELWHVSREMEPFNRRRFVDNLNRLPHPPRSEGDR